MTARPKVTGRRGIQIWVPVAPGPGFDETRAWVERLVPRLETHGDLFSAVLDHRQTLPPLR